MERLILAGDQSVAMRASALTPRLYRYKTGRDLLADMNKLKNAKKQRDELPKTATPEEIDEADGKLLAVLDIFLDVAYVMAKQADSSLPDTADEWLDTIDGVFSIHEVLPQILELWRINQATTSKPAKK